MDTDRHRDGAQGPSGLEKDTESPTQRTKGYGTKKRNPSCDCWELQTYCATMASATSKPDTTDHSHLSTEPTLTVGVPSRLDSVKATTTLRRARDGGGGATGEEPRRTAQC